MSLLEEHSFQHGEANGSTTHYVTAGPPEGPPIIFVHGWPGIGKTWKLHLEKFAELGFRAVAPDMPGYGQSSAPANTEYYSLRNINQGMLALLHHLGRDKAVWIGHDWGCGAVWSFAEHFPSHCIGVAGLAVPAHSVERGLTHLLTTVNRDRYPESEYPYGQWSYMRFYEQSHERAAAFFDANPAALLRLFFKRATPQNIEISALTANVVRDGGWFGGAAAPDPKWLEIPTEELSVDEGLLKELTEAMQKTGFWTADAWYLNHDRNEEYYGEAKDGGVLRMPTLFIGAAWDSVCDVTNSKLGEAQSRNCTDLTVVNIEAGHWLPQEKPQEVSDAIIAWVRAKCRDFCPPAVVV